MFKKTLLPVIPFILITILLEILTTYRGENPPLLPAYVFPAPSDIWATLTTESSWYIEGLQTTLFEALCGLAISIVAGISFALILGLSKTLEDAFYPYALFFQTVPLITIAPILVIWFGYGSGTAIASATIVSIFPIIINTLTGIRATDPALLDTFQLYGASRLQTLLLLRLPQAVPRIMVGIRISAGLALIGAIVGEFIGGGGLGSLVDTARTQQRLDRVFGAVLISSLAGIIMLSLIRVVSRMIFYRYRELRD